MLRDVDIAVRSVHSHRRVVTWVRAPSPFRAQATISSGVYIGVHSQRNCDAIDETADKRWVTPGGRGVFGMGEVVRGLSLIVGFTLHNVTKGTGP